MTMETAMDRLRPARPEECAKPRLERSGSLDRIRQFPAYLCSMSNPYVLSTTVQAGIEQGLNLVRGSLLIVTLYLGILMLTIQFSAMCFALLTGDVPPGLVFLLANMFFLCGMAAKTMGHDPEASQKLN